MRYLFALLLIFSLALSGCGLSSGGGSGASDPTDSDDPSTVTYTGSKVSLTTDDTGKAKVISDTLGITYEIITQDSSGNPITGVTLVYSEDGGKSVVYVKDPSGTYADIVLVGTPTEIWYVAGRSKSTYEPTDDFPLALELQAKSSDGIWAGSSFISGVYLSKNYRSGAGWTSGCFTPSALAAKLTAMDSSKNVVLTVTNTMDDDKYRFMYTGTAWRTNGADLVEGVNDLGNMIAEDYTYVSYVTCYEPASGALYDNGIGAVCEIEQSPSYCGRVLHKTKQTTSYADYDDGYYQAGINPEMIGDHSGDGIVEDIVHELIWEDQIYAVDASNKTTWANAPTRCSDLSSVDNYYGKTDWRLPNIMELESLKVYGSATPAMDSHFTSTGANAWASDSVNASFAYLWLAGGNITGVMDATITYNSRCVSGTTKSANYEKDDDTGIVADRSTGLMWTVGTYGAASTWSGALSLCHGKTTGGYTDWRLPNVSELMSIVNTSASPAINSNFSNMIDGGYDFWTATVSPDNTGNAYIVNFTNGSMNTSDRTSATPAAETICVRGGL